MVSHKRRSLSPSFLVLSCDFGSKLICTRCTSGHVMLMEPTFGKVIDREHCYDFLLGLTDSFEEVRGRIMGMKPLP